MNELYYDFSSEFDITWLAMKLPEKDKLPPGDWESSIEKMIHPTSSPCLPEGLSPFLISLCSNVKILHFLASKINNNSFHIYKYIFYFERIKRFYTSSEINKVKLNSSMFIEVNPTKQYFKRQKLITIDVSKERKKQQIYKALIYVAFFLNMDVFTSLVLFYVFSYAININKNELSRVSKFKSEQHSVCLSDMTMYINKSCINSFVAQNSKECCSDKIYPHFQFVPNVTLPIFSAPIIGDGRVKRVSWPLPTFMFVLNADKDSVKLMSLLQHKINYFSKRTNVSVTTLVYKINSNYLRCFFILKKNCSNIWGLDTEDNNNKPGWLESSGVFILNSHQAKCISQKKALNYFNKYAPADKYSRSFLYLISL
ncbi:hypothetical protein SME10J_50330 (plasmid) [Serratia marcescens]|nr:hypothetical protein SME10J_50330 [Serratia marcescens]